MAVKGSVKRATLDGKNLLFTTGTKDPIHTGGHGARRYVVMSGPALLSRVTCPQVFLSACDCERDDPACKHCGPRYLIDEKFDEAAGYRGQYREDGPPDYVVKEWSFHYSDGDVETVTRREP